MATNMLNKAFHMYTDDNAVDWNVFGEDGGPGAGVDGHTTDYTKPYWGSQNKRHHVRYAVYQDATSFRTIKVIVYTPAAFAAIVPGATLSVPVAGSATAVTYTLSAKVPEKQSIPKASRQLAE